MDTPTAATDGRPLRRDAERNRAAILVAAREVFAASGLDASLDDIAAQAGLGVGTVYRRFPSKAHLVEALFEELLDRSAALAEGALADPDPARALVALVEDLAELHATNHGLREVLLGATFGHDRLERARRRLDDATAALIIRAQAAGGIHPDLDAGDFPVLMVMIGAVGDLGRVVDPDLWRRYVPFLVAMIRPGTGPVAPLPRPPLRLDQVDEALTTRPGRRRRPSPPDLGARTAEAGARACRPAEQTGPADVR